MVGMLSTCGQHEPDLNETFDELASTYSVIVAEPLGTDAATSMASVEQGRLDRVLLRERLGTISAGALTSAQSSQVAAMSRTLDRLIQLDQVGYGIANSDDARPYTITPDTGAYIDANPVLSTVSHLDAWIAEAPSVAERMKQELMRSELEPTSPANLPSEAKLQLRSKIAGLINRGGPDTSAFRVVSDASDVPNVDPELARMIGEAQVLYRERLVPELRRLHQVLAASDRPARSGPGIWASENGAAYYRAAFAYYTESDVSPAQGAELARASLIALSESIESLSIEEAEGDAEVEDVSLTEPERFRTEIQLAIAWAQEHIDDFVTAAVVAPLDVRTGEGATGTIAEVLGYESASENANARLLLNPTLIPEWPDHLWRALIMRQALPGRHLLEGQPGKSDGAMRTHPNGLDSAGAEGWASYGLVISDEQGAFEDEPKTRLGFFQLLQLEAALVIVDQGIHEERWSREEAIDFLETQTGLPTQPLQRLVDATILRPGKNAAPFIGRVRVEQLRDRADMELGPDFNLRTFHDRYLAGGLRPYSLIESDITNWIDEVIGPTLTE